MIVAEELTEEEAFCGKETESGVRVRGFSEGSDRRAYEEDAEVDADADADDRGGVPTLAALVLICGKEICGMARIGSPIESIEVRLDG